MLSPLPERKEYVVPVWICYTSVSANVVRLEIYRYNIIWQPRNLICILYRLKRSAATPPTCVHRRAPPPVKVKVESTLRGGVGLVLTNRGSRVERFLEEWLTSPFLRLRSRVQLEIH